MDTAKELTAAMLTLLGEGIEGRAGGTTWFHDGDGLLATVRPLGAARASRALEPGGATVAGHVEHVRWFLALLNAYARGERPEIAWSESWRVREVDEDAWAALLDALERESAELREHFAQGSHLAAASHLLPSLATIVHVGYHVGAVRQLVKATA